MTAIDLFAGAGGLSLALQDSGYKILMANEINPRFAETHKYNFPNVPLIQKDINEVTSTDLKEIIGNQEVDLVVGGPPCQGFSVFGKRRFVNTQEYDPHKDPRNFLVYQYIRIVKELKPKFFFMENVKGFTNLDKGLFVEEVKNSLEIWAIIIFGVRSSAQQIMECRKTDIGCLWLETDWVLIFRNLNQQIFHRNPQKSQSTQLLEQLF